MKTSHLPKFIAALACTLIATTAFAQTQPLTSEQLAKRTIQRRAVEAAIWGQPIVMFDAMRQAYFRDAKAKYNDVIWWPRGADWKSQNLTPNSVARYIFFNGNTAVDGPIVFELPAGDSKGRAFFVGTISDAWWEPLVDIGNFTGADKGKGGKYLILPADYKGKVPPGYIPVRTKTRNFMMAVRSLLAGYTPENVALGDGQVKRIKVYPLSKATNPAPTRFIDMTGVTYEALPRYDETFYTSLARMLDEEPVQERDKLMMGMLLPLGLEKGKAFKPDEAMNAQLKAGVEEAHAYLMEGLVRTSQKYWPDRKWVVPMPAIAAPVPPTAPHWAPQFKWQAASYFDMDSRGIALASFFCPPAKLITALYYLASFEDAGGQPLNGSNTYRLHVPADVPVAQQWSVTVYNKETSALFRESTRVALGSKDPSVKKNADGSIDIYIGPKAPAGQESNWIHTPAGQGWWPWFRFFGPEQALWDKAWKLPDIELVK
jgi:hypothetical protein